MRPSVEILRAHQAQIEDLQRRDAALARQVEFIARMAGLAPLTAAGEESNLAGVPVPPAEPPTTTTQEARAPARLDSVETPGGAPTGVAPGGATSVDQSETMLPPAAEDRVDVTRPVQGTDEVPPIGQAEVYPQLRTPDPAANTEVANPWTIRSSQTQATTADSRFVASLRLAKLKNALAGTADQDEIVQAQRITDDPSLSDEAIRAQIQALSAVAAAAAEARVASRRDLVPTRTATAAVPQFAAASTAGGIEDQDLFLG